MTSREARARIIYAWLSHALPAQIAREEKIPVAQVERVIAVVASVPGGGVGQNAGRQ